MPSAIPAQRALFCRGNFFISKFQEGLSRCLKPFWARSPVCRAERADQPFSVVTAWRPFKRAKPAAWDPPPGFPIRAYSERDLILVLGHRPGPSLESLANEHRPILAPDFRAPPL